MMNSGKSVFKRTNIDRLMNILIVGVSGLNFFDLILSLNSSSSVLCSTFRSPLSPKFELPWKYMFFLKKNEEELIKFEI